MPVPSWNQSQQFLQPSRALNPSHPNSHVSLFSFCRRRAFPSFLLGSTSHGGRFSGSPREAEVAGTQLSCARGNWLDTGQVMVPEEGEQPPCTRSPSPNPLDAATFASSSTRGAWPLCVAGVSRVRRWLRRSSGTGGGSGTPRLSVRPLCFLTQQETLSPSRTLPVSFPVPRCRTSHGCYSLTTSPSWQLTAAPHPRGGCVGGTDPTPGHVPAALCDLPAWHRVVTLHPPHPAGHLRAARSLILPADSPGLSQGQMF